MRCKNCGSQNEDGRYICQNCGSPLYDEDDEILEDGEQYDDSYYEEDKKNTKKSVVIIIILAVVLVTLVAGFVFAISLLGNSGKENSTSEAPGTSDVIQQNTDNTTEKTTEKTTESTTESTTEKTTEKETEKITTTESTTEAKFRVTVDIDGNGTVSGDGEYTSGKRATLVAAAEAGAQFIGWYDNDVLVASGNKYSFNVTEDRNLKAVFQKTTEADTSDQQQQQQQ